MLKNYQHIYKTRSPFFTFRSGESNITSEVELISPNTKHSEKKIAMRLGFFKILPCNHTFKDK